MCGRLSLCNEVSSCEGIRETQRSRPYDTLSWYFHTALRLGKCQSILTLPQHPIEIDLTFSRTFPFASLTCSQVGPTSLVAAGSTRRTRTFSSFKDRRKTQTVNILDMLKLLFHLRWRRDVLQPPEVLQDEHNCTYSRWRSPVHFLESERTCWVSSFFATLQGEEACESYVTLHE